jgi:regulator of protease activity HflC (stomatin/prohibitin superfamily)
MTEPSKTTASTGGPGGREPTTGQYHFGLLFTAAATATVAAVVAAFYGVGSGSVALSAAACQLSFAAVCFWFAIHAAYARTRVHVPSPSVAAAEEPATEPVQPVHREPDASPSLGWGDEEVDEFESGWGDSPEEKIIEQREPWTREEADLARLQHSFALGAATLVFVLIPTIWVLLASFRTDPTSFDTKIATALGVLALAASCLWLVLARTFAGTPKTELPEKMSLAMAARESYWAGIVVAVAAFGSLVWTPLQHYLGIAMLFWVLAVGLELIIRLLAMRFAQGPEPTEFESPQHLSIREGMFVRGNPVASVFATIEAKFGVSFRSSWAIRFVRVATIPTIVAVLLMYWLMSGLVIVGVDEMGVRENFGKVSGEPLGPGLHVKMPWPFGRIVKYPVKRIDKMAIGFRVENDEPRALLWTEPHAAEEFHLALGDGDEAVAVNAFLFYKIREDEEGFFDYVFGFQNADGIGEENASVAALESYAYRVLMELTRDKRLHSDLEEDDPDAVPDVLSTDRTVFAKTLQESLRQYAEKHRLGLEVVDVALVNLHPPVDAAAEYLEAISAEIDRGTYVLEAEGEANSALLEAEAEKSGVVSKAEIYKSQRVSEAQERKSQFERMYQQASNPALVKRQWYETLERVLSKKKLFLIDGGVAGEQGETIIDLRPAVAGDPAIDGD